MADTREETLEPQQSKQGQIGLTLGAVAIILSLVALVGTAVAMLSDSDGVGGGGQGGGQSAAASGKKVELEVEAGDLFFKPKEVTVGAGDELVVTFKNTGKVVHNLQVEGDSSRGTGDVQPGETANAVSLGTFAEDALAWCTIPGHREAGMEFKIKVTSSAPGGESAGSAATASAEGAKIDFQAEPGDDWKPRDPSLDPAPAATEHNITLVASEKVLEVAPGVTQEMWVFNGQFPGPIIRGKVGDVFNITLENRGKIGHSIDFHASLAAWDDEMRTIQPGEKITYRFQATKAGIFMYHCGTNPALHHIGNGMHGAIIIDPPDLQPVDREFAIVQSEIYTGPEGKPGDLNKMIRDEWDAVVFNGYVNQYKYAPIEVNPGERIRVWVQDNGPSENSSFHVVGTIFDTVFKEGTYLLRPGPTSGGAQALDLQPAQGGFVEFSLSEPGLYPFVTHKFSNVAKGAVGLFKAGEPPDRENDGKVQKIG